MKLYCGLILSCAILSIAHETNAQGPYTPGNRIQLVLNVSVKYGDENDGFCYQFMISDQASSAQSLSQFWVLAPNSPQVTKVQNVADWFRVDVNQVNDTTWIQWGADSAAAIRPGQTEGGFSFWSDSPPGIVRYYAEGWTPEPDVDESQLDSLGRIVGYNDLTPYGGGITGKTIGPVPISFPFVGGAFLDTLISYKHQCLTLGWLKDDKAHKEDCDEMMKERNWYKRGEFEKFRK